MLLLQCGLVLIFLNCVRTTESVYDYGLENSFTEYERRFSYWPSVHNGLMRLRKREAPQVTQASDQGKAGPSEGGGGAKLSPGIVQQTTSVHPAADVKNKTKIENLGANNVSNVAESMNKTEKNINATVQVPTEMSLGNPGAMKRSIIVFGGFLMLGVAYFIFYRKKGPKNDVTNTHNANDANQFRYGVLQSEDRRDNLELSQIPLTMESDDDDDEDLEIFDLEQKKKSLSYVNLQTNDEEIVFHNSRDDRGDDKDNLLLDIEDAASDTLINWSNNGNKSIL